MYRDRPPPRGGYRPPPSRPYQAQGYRDDRDRPRAPYHPGYPDHGHPESYRRSPPRRRYPSPPSGNHQGGEYWAGGPPRDRSPSPRGSVPLDHNLLITVGNELTGPSGSAPPRHHERDYPPRPAYERSRSRGRSRPGSRERSPDRSRAKSRGRSKSRARSKSRPRSHSFSPDRSRAKSRGRSKSRSPDRSRAKSRGRSKSRSPDRSRAKSRGRSKSRPRSRSRSRSRSRGRSLGRGYSKAASRGRSKSRQRSRSVSSSSSSSSDDDSDKKSRKEFKELETARRRKELEEMLGPPTKSILKKRNDSEDSPSLRSLDSPRGEGSSLSRVAEQLLQAVKGMEPHMVATMLSELRSDPQMAHRAGLDAEIKEILNLLGGQDAGGSAPEKNVDDIDDEEKFLYGDSEEPKPPPSAEPVRHHGLDLYGDVTEDALYGDYPPQMAVSRYGLPAGASPHLSVPPTMGEVDMRYTSRPTINPEQNIKIQVSNPAFPPGTEPLEDSERQAVEEYEKIQDLLKTIGLDLGVTEISKMAARTKERLHGNKPPPKTPTRRRYSSDSSNDSRPRRGRRRRSQSGSSSSSSSRSHSRGRGASWSSNDSNRKSSAPPKSLKDREVKEVKTGRSEAALPQPPPKLPPQQLPQIADPNTLPSHPGAAIPTFPSSQVHSMIPPNYPPPGYGQFGNYHPYMHQQWPPMYPPPMTMPPPTGHEEFPPTLPYTQQYNKPIPEPEVKGLGKSSGQDVEKGSCKASSHERIISEEQNNESQKQKVLEEREKLRQERDTRMKKKEHLMKELERLRKQQGELLRKKRREKDGHKDPLLQEISRLQEEVMAQISNLRKEHESAEKKRSEIDKVALILGLNPTDRPRKLSKQPGDQKDQPPKLLPPEKKKWLAEKSPEERQTASSSTIKMTVEPPLAPRPSLDKKPVSAQPPPSTLPPDPFDYYDAGNHWCKNCNVTSGSMFDFFTHLHNKSHRKTLDPYDRPWAPTPTKIAKNTSSVEKLTKPAKGSEFLLPVRGFFCLLCKEFYGDAICAEEHVTTHKHNENYKKQMYENPLYEQRRNLDRQAGLTLDTSGKKRKHDDSEKGNNDKEEKPKHKKDKKEKDKKRETDDSVQKEEKIKVRKEEQEGKTKPGKKEQDFKDTKSSDGERTIYSKKDEGEKNKFIKKDDKYRYNREEEETDKNSKREESDKSKYGREEEYRYRYRKDEDDKCDHPKYGPRDDESRFKYGKSSDFRSKNDREESKPKVEREAFRKLEAEKPAAKAEVSKPEPPTKPYDLPKVFCGPSPAMRAKLRKQSLEAGKPATTAATPSFGRFTWKKKENVLAKEAQKAAAEFVKDDEDVTMQNTGSIEDSFAKSMAVAKEIAQKLGGHQTKILGPTMPSPWVSNRGRIRPNLPAPAAVMRKAAMMGKPAPLNTFLSIRPQNTTLQGSSPKDLPTLNEIANTVSLPYIPMDATSREEPQIVGVKPLSPASRPEPFKAKTDPPVFGPVPFQVNPPPAVFKPSMPEVKPPQPISKPATFEVKPLPLVSKPPPFEVQPAPLVYKPAEIVKCVPSDYKPLPFQATTVSSVSTSAPSAVKPSQPKMIKIVSDVAAPGVPESEHTHTVFVKPPPFIKMNEGAQKSEKLKSNLAAAKAKDLFDIFYSSAGQSNSSTVTKTATDTRADGSSTKKCELSNLQVLKTQPLPQSQPPTVACTALQADSNKSSPGPQIQTETEKNLPGPKTQQETDKNLPGPQIQTETDKSPPGPTTRQETCKNLPGPQIQTDTDKNPLGPQIQTDTDKNPPGPQIQTETDKNPPGPTTQQETYKNLPGPQIQPKTEKNPLGPEVQQMPDKNPQCPQIQPETDKNPPSLKTQPESNIQIASVWSLQPTLAPKPDGDPCETTSQSNQSILNQTALAEAHNAPQNLSLISRGASQIPAQTDAELEKTSQTQTDPQSEPLTKQDPSSQSYTETNLDTVPVPESKAGRKTRGKITPAKKSAAARPVRQTRSQTRYQTRNQQQSQSEPEFASGDSDSAASDSKGLDTSDPGPGLQPGEAAAGEGEPPMVEMTPETLGLPSDMTSLDFEYDFNFE